MPVISKESQEIIWETQVYKLKTWPELLCVVLLMLWKTFKLDYPLGEKKMMVVFATTYSPLCFSQPLGSRFSACCLRSLSKAILQDIDTHWKESWSSLILRGSSTHGLLPLVKHLAHKLWQNTPEERKGFFMTAVHYLWTPAKFVQFEE